MSAEGRAHALAVHATAVAIGGRALLIFGRSGAGKSRLAAALVAASRSHRRIMLVGDDRVLLTSTARGLQVRPHPRLAGFIECRGLGLVAMPWRERAIVAGSAILAGAKSCGALALADLPQLVLVADEADTRAERVLAWFGRIGKETTGRGDVADAETF